MWQTKFYVLDKGKDIRCTGEYLRNSQTQNKRREDNDVLKWLQGDKFFRSDRKVAKSAETGKSTLAHDRRFDRSVLLEEFSRLFFAKVQLLHEEACASLDKLLVVELHVYHLVAFDSPCSDHQGG